MSKAVNYIPDGYAIATPYLTVSGASDAIAFYERAFGATEKSRLVAPDGQILHAEIEINGGVIMIADHADAPDSHTPHSLGGTPVRINLFVPNIDSFVEQAVAEGATIVKPIADQFFGERNGRIEDPYGYVWIISTHFEDVSPEEMQKRLDDMMG